MKYENETYDYEEEADRHERIDNLCFLVFFIMLGLIAHYIAYNCECTEYAKQEITVNNEDEWKSMQKTLILANPKVYGPIFYSSVVSK